MQIYINNNQSNKRHFKYLGLALLLFSNIFNLVLQYSFLTTKWSPFSINHLNINHEIINTYILAMIFLTLGFFSMGLFLRNKQLTTTTENLQLDSTKLFNLIKLTTLLLFVFLILTQLSLGHANIFNLWVGLVRGPDVEVAIKNSVLGIHGFLLILIFISLILLMAFFRSNLKTNFWILSMVVLSFLSSISQGKVQLLFYFAVVYLVQQELSLKSFYKFTLIVLAIVIVFFITRLLRNQGVGLDSSIDTFLFFTVGLYLGSPFVNTSYVLDHIDSMNSCWEFFIHMIPSRFILNSELHSHFPDISSPSGFIGNGLMLGGPHLLFFYSFFIGLFIHYLYVKSLTSLTIKLFYPFLISACLLSFLYDHFTNLMFFWMPMILSFTITKFIVIKKFN